MKHAIVTGAHDSDNTDDIITPSVAAQMLETRVGTLAAWRSRRVGPPWFQLSPRMPRYSRRAIRDWLATRTIGVAA